MIKFSGNRDPDEAATRGAAGHIERSIKLSTSTNSIRETSLFQTDNPSPLVGAPSIGRYYNNKYLFRFQIVPSCVFHYQSSHSSVQDMQSVLGGTVQKAGEAISHAMSSNRKTADMKGNVRELGSKDPLSTDFGVRMPAHDEWLSASTGDRQGPLLLEDNFAREKVNLQPQYTFDLSNVFRRL